MDELVTTVVSVNRNYTTSKSTVIDYFIATTDFLSVVNNFSILNFSKLFSDVHCALQCELVFKKNVIGQNAVEHRL